ncbi:MAG: peptidoglycan DD-metalloendopeptidase family protein [Anaerolineae bacterium]
MNADVETDTPEPVALLVGVSETIEELPESEGTEQSQVDPPSEWRADKQIGVSSVRIQTVSLPLTHPDRPGAISARLVSHVAVLVLLGSALLLGRLSWARWPTAPVSPARAFKQRVLLFAPRNQLAYFGTSAGLSKGIERGFLKRQIPAVTADTSAFRQPFPSTRLRTSDRAQDTAGLGVGLGRGGSMFVDAGFVTRGIDPEGSLIPVARTDVVTYSVRYGDTLWDIAAKFNITQDTLWANNDLSSPDMLSVNDELVIPPIDGLIYTVRRGDTLAGLAKRYRTSPEAIVNYASNDLAEGQELAVGQKIMIPGGVKPIPPRRTVSLTSAPPGALKGAGAFVMPVSGNFTQGFRSGHPAIDIGAPKGTPVYAADAGYVSFAGWHPWGYGYAVEIDHGNGFRTLYAHLSWYSPDLGQSVRRGELIGGVGSTYGSGGWSSGSHLHFEIIHNGAKRNPCVFLACP